MQSNIQQQIESTFAFKSLGAMVTNLWGVAFVLGSVAAFLFVVMGGVLWITAGGDKGKVEAAKERITQGLVGLAILAVSWAVALLVQQFLGLSILGGGSGGGGSGGSGTCDGYANNTTQCRNQDCQFYTCTNGTWGLATGRQPESTCMANRSGGCYGNNSGFDPNATP
jgi:hypothetical protein